MALPKRQYRTLKQAASELSANNLKCEIQDLIHYAAIGKLEICARIYAHFHKEPEGGIAKLSVPILEWMKQLEIKPTEYVSRHPPTLEEITQDCIRKMRTLSFSIQTEFGDISVRGETQNDFADAVACDALFALPQRVFKRHETRILKEGLSVSDWISLPRNSKAKIEFSNRTPQVFEVNSHLMPVDMKEEDYIISPFFFGDYHFHHEDLLITSEELKTLKDGGKQVEEISQRKNAAWSGTESAVYAIEVTKLTREKHPEAGLKAIAQKLHIHLTKVSKKTAGVGTIQNHLATHFKASNLTKKWEGDLVIPS